MYTSGIPSTTREDVVHIFLLYVGLKISNTKPIRLKWLLIYWNYFTSSCIYWSKKGDALKLSTGKLKKPWISFWCRSIVMMWLKPKKGTDYIHWVQRQREVSIMFKYPNVISKRLTKKSHSHLSIPYSNWSLRLGKSWMLCILTHCGIQILYFHPHTKYGWHWTLSLKLKFRTQQNTSTWCFLLMFS